MLIRTVAKPAPIIAPHTEENPKRALMNAPMDPHIRIKQIVNTIKIGILSFSSSC
jgi:hypothetical protein